MYRIFKDGSSWCATGPGFINLQESLAGFGDSKMQALHELENAELKAEMRRREDVRSWKCGNCTTSFGRATPNDAVACPVCKCGDRFVKEKRHE